MIAHATLHSYAVAYWIAAAIFAAGALVVGALYRPGASAELSTDTSVAVEDDPVLDVATVG